MAEIETVLLANHAEAVNGLLYLSGGGWSHHWRGPRQEGQPMPSQIAFAATITAGADEPPGTIPFSFRITTANGNEVIRADGSLTIGPGDSTSVRRVPVVANVGIAFPEEGHYRLTVEIPNSTRSVEFWVHDQPMPGMPAQPPGDQGFHPGDNSPGYI